MNFSLYYRKNKNEELFKALENSNLGVDKYKNMSLYMKNSFLSTQLIITALI